MSLNKVITSVNALANNVSIPPDKLNNVVCIDTVNNRIGVQTANPTREIDISGMLKTNYIYINNENNSIDSFDISYDNSFLTFSRGLKINDGISCENIVCNEIEVRDIIGDVSFANNLYISGDVSFANNVDITGNVTAANLTTGSSWQPSDDRYKHNEKNINNGLEIIRQLEPQIYQKTFTFKNKNYKGNLDEFYITEAGLIAQDVYAINDISYTVSEGNLTKPYYLNYNNIFVYGLAGIKELDKIVNQNINDISYMSNKIENIAKGTPDISNINLLNIENLIISQNKLIQALNSKISTFDRRINNLENK